MIIRGILSVSLVFFAGLAAPVFATTRAILLAESDVDVFEGAPDRTATTDILRAGIGRGLREGRLISYVEFDLSPLPSSNLLEGVSIESGQLRLFAQSYGLARSEERFFVTVSACSDSNWPESSMTWNSRPCINVHKGEDSLVVKGTELPAAYAWDVTRSVAETHAAGKKRITFVIEAFPLKDSPREIVPGRAQGPEESVGFVRFWSRERLDFGVNAIPILLVNHSSSSTSLVNFVSSILAILSALGVAFGLYEAFQKLRGKQER
jgi:hypothetical protein